jgi:hypothetical protein
MTIWSLKYKLIDFLRLPRPQGERRKSIYSPFRSLPKKLFVILSKAKNLIILLVL